MVSVFVFFFFFLNKIYFEVWFISLLIIEFFFFFPHFPSGTMDAKFRPRRKSWLNIKLLVLTLINLKMFIGFHF